MLPHFYCVGELDASVLAGIFLASVRAVLCAATLAACGLWMSRAGVMTPALSKGLSQLSVKLAIPALLFSSMVPGMTFELMAFAWPLLLLPVVYLLLGALIGWLILLLVSPPDNFRLGTVAACTFGNTTGIPIVLLSVLQQSLSRSVYAEVADPLLFLSIELVTFPLLQWLVGMLLLRMGGSGLATNALGSPEALAAPMRRHAAGEVSNSHISMMSAGEDEQYHAILAKQMSQRALEREAALAPSGAPCGSAGGGVGSLGFGGSCGGFMAHDPAAELRHSLLHPMTPERGGGRAATAAHRLRAACGALGKVLKRVLVPQVAGILLGGATGLYGRPLLLPPETAPLGWVYLAVSKLGAAAVPINLILLGAALSRTPASRSELPPLTAVGILAGRFVFMPCCGLLVATALASLPLEVPFLLADPFWLVCLILTCTPTANNIVVMCELAGENRRAMSAAIFYQYVATPFVLPLILTIFVAFICQTRGDSVS